MVFRKSFLLFDSKKLALFPLSLWLSAGRNLLISFPIFFFSPLTSTRASPRITAGWVVVRVSKLSRVSGCRSHHLNPSLPRSVPGSSADPGGAQEAGGPVPHLLQPRFGPEHGPRRAFGECCFLLCRGRGGRAGEEGVGPGRGPAHCKAPPSRSDCEGSQWGSWVSRGLPRLCP